MKVAIAQINPTVGDIQGNVKKIIEFGLRASEQKADLVIFPELAICGYPPMDLLLKDSFIKANEDGLVAVGKALKHLSVMIGCIAINKDSGRPLHNACVLLEAGEVKDSQHKTLLPTYDVFDEDRYFEPARNYNAMSVGGLKFAVSICEDIWRDDEIFPQPRYTKDPIEELWQTNPDVLVNISASPYCLAKENVRHELVRSQALRRGVPVIYVNQVGGNDHLVFDGRSLAVNAKGEVIAAAAAFEEDLITVDLDKQVGEIRSTPVDPTENIYQALVLGTRDYMSKCHFKKAVIGLSGGIDSAVVCAIAVKAVGPENVVGVSMPSCYSSQGSLEDARLLAEALGIKCDVVPIEKAMRVYDDMLGPIFADTKSDITEENLQARLRGLILMAISNKFGNLVLTTGNKSELAVGYCTLYGDMCGGLAVIADVPKTTVYDLARYINAKEGKDVIPKCTISKPPSAELRPDQTDQDTLPPYVILDGIIHAYVEQRRSPDQIARLGYKPEVVMDVINRIDRNEYKRHQAAPGLKVTARSFGAGWRMPIAQGFKERLSPSDLLC